MSGLWREERTVFAKAELDMSLLAHALAVEAESPDAVAMCRWEGPIWVQPEEISLDGRDREAIQYLLALRAIDSAAHRVVAASDAWDAANVAAADAQRELHRAGQALREALARDDYVGGLPNVPLAVGDVVVIEQGRKDKTTVFRAIRGISITATIAPTKDV